MYKRLGKPIQNLRQQQRFDNTLGLQKYTLYNQQKQFILFAYQNFIFVCSMRKGRIVHGQQVEYFAKFIFSRDFNGWKQIQQIQLNALLSIPKTEETIAAFFIPTIQPTVQQKKAQLLALGIQPTLVDRLFSLLQMPQAQQRAMTTLVAQITTNIKNILSTATGNNNNNMDPHIDKAGGGIHSIQLQNAQQEANRLILDNAKQNIKKPAQQNINKKAQEIAQQIGNVNVIEVQQPLP